MKLWNLIEPAHPQPSGSASLPSSALHGVTMSSAPDRPTLVVLTGPGESDQQADLWDFGDPTRPVHAGSVPNSSDPITAVALGPRGTLVTGRLSGSVTVWDVTDRAMPRATQELRGGTGEVQEVAIDPSLSYVAASGDPGLVWDLAVPGGIPPVRRLTGHASGAFSLTFAGSSPVLLTGGNDNSARRWTLRGGGTATLPDRVTGMAADGSRGVAVVATDDGAVSVVATTDPARPTMAGRLPAPVPFAPADLAIAPGGRIAAVAGGPVWPIKDGRLDVVDLTAPSSPAPMWSSPIAWSSSAGMALRPDGAVVATDDGEGVLLRSTELAPAATTLAASPDGDFGGFSPELAFRPDGQVLAMADSGIDETNDPARGRERLQLWDVADPTHPRPLGAPTYRDLDAPPSPQAGRPPTALQFTPDGRYLLSLQGDAAVAVWDVSDPGAARSVGRLTTAAGSYSGFAVSPDGRTVAAVSSSFNPTLDIWDITDPAQPARGGQRPLATAEATVAFATAATLLVADGTRLIALPTDLDAQIRRICTEAGAELTEQQWREHVGPDISRRPLC